MYMYVDVLEFNDCLDEFASEAVMNCIDMRQTFSDKDANLIY